MNDFLHNIRSGNTKRYDRPRKNYDRPGYPGQDRQYNRDRKNHQQRKGPDAEMLGAVRKLLEALVENQRRSADIEERRVEAEERKALAMEKIADRLERFEGPAAGAGSRDPGLSRASHEDRERVVEIIVDKRREGMSYEKIAQHLQDTGVPTFSGKGQWRGQTVHRLWKKM